MMHFPHILTGITQQRSLAVTLCTALLSLLGIIPPARAELTFLSELRLPKGGGEILTYDPATGHILTTRGSWLAQSVQHISLADPRKPVLVGETNLKPHHPAGVASVSSVAADPKGRGFMVASLVPKDSTQHLGRVAVIDTRSLEVICTLEAGWHPDCIIISKDGRWLMVANEAEYQKYLPNRPGSIGVADLSNVKTPADMAGVIIRDFPLGPEHVVPGVVTPNETDPARRHLDLEPEYITEDGAHAYVSLQENNAIAVFDLRAQKWARIFPLGSWNVRMDASDRDGPWGRRSLQVNDEVETMPMPDTISAIRIGGRTLIVSGNEGDSAETARVKHLGTDGKPLSPALRAELKNLYGMDPQHDAALGRLRVSKYLGDLNGDGRQDKLIASGTRSFSIWDAATGKRVYDSGSFFEDHAVENDPASFNHNRGRLSEWDTRSKNRGPEPEAVKAAFIQGVPMAIIANERQGGLYAFDIRDPAHPRLSGYDNGARIGGHSLVESVLHLPPEATSIGQDIIVTGWEGSSSITLHIVTP